MNNSIKNNNFEPGYDLVIIGGGIYGTALLWEASHRGLRTLLLEKDDFCSATSANSLKTIHGGLRYLQQLNFKRTIECDREKVILQKIAPNLIKPLNCCLAVANKTTKSYLSFWFAAKLFNFLSCLNPLGSGRFTQIHARAKAQKNLAVFKPAFLKNQQHDNYLVWQDAQVLNSEHLALSFITSAKNYNAKANNYCLVNEVIKQKNDYLINFTDCQQSSQQCTSHFVVDCTSGAKGNAHFASPITSNLNYVAALNLVLDESLSDYLFALSSYNAAVGKSGMLTFSPWKKTTLAGTWYFNRQQVSHRSDISEKIIDDCVQDVFSAFSDAGLNLSKADIHSKILDIHLGFLPADKQQSNPEKALLSKPRIINDGCGFYILQGNKYTTARLNAKKLVDQISKSNANLGTNSSHAHNINISPSQSHSLALQDAGLAPTDHNDDPAWQIMAERYGSALLKLKEFSRTSNSDLTLAPDSTEIYQLEVDFLVQDESLKKLPDLFYRRLNINAAKPISPATIQWCAHRLGLFKKWDDAEIFLNIKLVEEIEMSKQHKQSGQ